MIKNSIRAVALFATSAKSHPHLNDAHQDAMREFARARGIDIAGFLAIDEQSLYIGIKHAISLCAQTNAKHIIVDKLKTVALPQRDLFEILEMLASAEINLTLVEAAREFSSDMLATLREWLTLSTLADNQLRSQKIKSALLKKKRKGKILGSRKFGTEANEAYVINQMIELRNQGLTLQKICTMLETNQITSTQKKKWHPTTVKRILERAKNISY